MDQLPDFPRYVTPEGWALRPTHTGVTKMAKTKKLYTVKEIAQALGVTRATVQVWIRAQKIPGKRDGWRYLVPRGPLVKFAEEHGLKSSALH